MKKLIERMTLQVMAQPRLAAITIIVLAVIVAVQGVIVLAK